MTFIVEAAGSGISLIQYMRRRQMPVFSQTAKQDKMTREIRIHNREITKVELETKMEKFIFFLPNAPIQIKQFICSYPLSQGVVSSRFVKIDPERFGGVFRGRGWGRTGRLDLIR